MFSLLSHFFSNIPPRCRVTEQGNKVPAVGNPPGTWQLLIASDLVSTRSNDSFENIIKKYRIFLYSYMTNTWNWHIYREININNFLKSVLIILLYIILYIIILHSQIKLRFYVKNKRKNFIIKAH